MFTKISVRILMLKKVYPVLNEKLAIYRNIKFNHVCSLALLFILRKISNVKDCIFNYSFILSLMAHLNSISINNLFCCHDIWHQN